MADVPVRLDDLIAFVDKTAPDADPLARIGVAASVAATVTDLGDHLVGTYVDAARAAGCSWTDIGQHLGVTKQAARQRFVPREDGGGRRAGMFGRFSEQARAAVVMAQEVARELGHGSIGPEHLLVGLCGEECRAVALLEACGRQADEVVRELRARMPLGDARPRGHIPFSPTAKKSLEQAVRQAKGRRVDSLGTEFVLLGILAAGDSVATDVLHGLGITEERAAAELDCLPEGE